MLDKNIIIILIITWIRGRQRSEICFIYLLLCARSSNVLFHQFLSRFMPLRSFFFFFLFQWPVTFTNWHRCNSRSLFRLLENSFFIFPFLSFFLRGVQFNWQIKVLLLIGSHGVSWITAEIGIIIIFLLNVEEIFILFMCLVHGTVKRSRS